MRLAFGLLFLVLGLFGLWVFFAIRADGQAQPHAEGAFGRSRTGSIGWSILNLALGLWFLARHFGVIG
jgi:hypothetical protein